MGGSSSKVPRTLPTRARTSGSGGKSSEVPHPMSRSRPVARETRDHGIDRDGKDPQLLSNLSRISIGQVNVQARPGTTTTISQVSDAYKTRDLAEQQATSARPVRNRLVAGALSSLLDDRKFVASRSELELLAARYTVDVHILESLAKFVSSPSIGEGTVVRTLGEDGQEKITMQAIWSEPAIKDDIKQI